MKQKFIDAYMDVAHRFAQLSTAKRLQVGAIIVKDDRIISIGYNGMPSGWDNTCEDRVYPNEWSITNTDWQYKDENGKPFEIHEIILIPETERVHHLDHEEEEKLEEMLDKLTKRVAARLVKESSKKKR